MVGLEWFVPEVVVSLVLEKAQDECIVLRVEHIHISDQYEQVDLKRPANNSPGILAVLDLSQSDDPVVPANRYPLDLPSAGRSGIR